MAVELTAMPLLMLSWSLGAWGRWEKGAGLGFGEFLIRVGLYITYGTPSGRHCCCIFTFLLLLFLPFSWPGICREFLRRGEGGRGNFSIFLANLTNIH